MTALACVLLALESCPITTSQYINLATRIKEVCNIDTSDPSVLACKAKLAELSDILHATEEGLANEYYTASPTTSAPIRDSISPTGVIDVDAINNEANHIPAKPQSQSQTTPSVKRARSCGTQ